MTDKMHHDSLREIYILFVDGLPALDPQEKELWKSHFDIMTEDECIFVMDTLIEQSFEFIERAKVELRNKPEAKEQLAGMERQAKTLLEEINAHLIALQMRALH